MSLRDAIQKFTDSIQDLTNLEVTTYTGKLEQLADPATGQIRWDELKPGSGKLVLAAATLVRPNASTVNFRATQIEAGDVAAILELHAAAVDSARSGRLALVKLFSGLVPARAGG